MSSHSRLASRPSCSLCMQNKITPKCELRARENSWVGNQENISPQLVFEKKWSMKVLELKYNLFVNYRSVQQKDAGFQVCYPGLFFPKPPLKSFM